jgi:hypothetical protein
MGATRFERGEYSRYCGCNKECEQFFFSQSCSLTKEYLMSENNGIHSNGIRQNWGRAQFDLNLDDVRQRVEQDDTGKWDHTISRTALSFNNGSLAFPLDNHCEHIEQLHPSPWALRQLCERIGIPVGYFSRCPAVLQDVQANYWLKHPAPSSVLRRRVQGLDEIATNGASDEDAKRRQENWLLRARYGELRGVLSERYARLDNNVLMTCLRELLSSMHSRFQIGWFGLSDESLHLRLVDTTIGRKVWHDDRLMAGIHIANSEVGKRAISVDAIIFRLICQNGLIRLVNGRSLLRRRHVSFDQDGFVRSLEEAVVAALGEALDFTERLILTAKQPVGDVEAAIKRLGRHWSLSEATQQQVQAALLREPSGLQETLYGLVNAFTYVAQTFADDDRYHLEVLAGQLAERGIYAAPHKAVGESNDFTHYDEELNEVASTNGAAHTALVVA